MELIKVIMELLPVYCLISFIFGVMLTILLSEYSYPHEWFIEEWDYKNTFGKFQLICLAIIGFVTLIVIYVFNFIKLLCELFIDLGNN